jgi:Flp pilus assembly protein TadD
MPPPKPEKDKQDRDQRTEQGLSRRALLKGMGLAPLLLRPAPLCGPAPLFAAPPPGRENAFPFADFRLTPRYPEQSPLADVLRLVPPGSDDYVTEKHAHEIGSLLRQWGEELKAAPSSLSAPRSFADGSIVATSLAPAKQTSLRASGGIEVARRQFDGAVAPGRERFLGELERWLGPLDRVATAEFEITGIEEVSTEPVAARVDIRFDVVVLVNPGRREERVGTWRTEWFRDPAQAWKARRWEAVEETRACARGPFFADETARRMAGAPSYREQLLRGADDWPTVLDGACGIDIYGNNGVAAGDFDGDGFDDLYVCQPAGLPNRLYRNRGDGSFEDVTERAGVGALDNTACAIFADFENKGRQDLLVVCGSGPLLFLNRGDGTFALKPDAFQFKTAPSGTFTHAAVADYDGDGRLDIYFCLYSYYLGLDQYHYPVPYYDARNGPPNFLLHNEGDGTFVDRTEAAGLSAENDRYSFACAWGCSRSKSQGAGLPDLYVVNDFGRANLYRNNGDGSFAAVSEPSHAADAGAGMSACWCDYDNDGREDLYAANMWSAAGQRVSTQKRFHETSSAEALAQYRRHARGNALYRNRGDGGFENVGERAGVAMGRWSWSSDFWDFDHDGRADLYVANGYISAPGRDDLASFFWRQVVGRSPDDSTPSIAYERGWQALNELIRSDTSWSGYERNVLFANLGDGTFAEVSGVAGLDFAEDGRSFALADLDHDGRLEVVLKSRNAPQLRILRNALEEIGGSLAFRLRGTRSNRDAIGAAVTVEAGELRQTKYLQAGSGFLAQHSKEVFFGVGKPEGAIRATVRWPSGLTQSFENVPLNHRIEIEEGAASFVAKPFAPAGKVEAPSAAQPQSQLEQSPSTVETWLIDPLKAPEFSLPDLAGTLRELRSWQGQRVLLNFWAADAPGCREQLRALERNRRTLAASKLAVLAINVDASEASPAARSLAGEEKLGFPVLFATEEVAGIYNIVYRYLFDRRRNLALPSSFLLDESGRIVKIYQGALDPLRVAEDAKSIPATAEERAKRALPFAGTLHQGAFVRNDFSYGVAMFQHGYLAQAQDSFEQVIAAKPDDPEAHYNLGTLNLRRNDLTQARRYLERTVQLRPDYPEAWNNLGMIAAQQGHADEAVRNFQQSLRLRPAYAIALLNLGNVYRRQREFDKARQCLDRALQLQPDDPEVNYSLGMLCAQQNQLDDAASFLRKATELRPNYPEAWNNLGVLFVRRQDYAQAEEQFRACIRLVPSFDQSYLNLARLYALRGDKPKAREVLGELERLQPGNIAAKQALEMLESAP